MKQPELLQPPKRLQALKVGESTTLASSHRIICIAKKPHMFVLRNVMSKTMCSKLQDQSKNKLGAPTTTVQHETKFCRPHTEVAMMDAPIDFSMLLMIMKDLVHPEFLPYTCLEELQVVKYGPQGEYTMHHDGIPRFMTVLYYCTLL